MTTLHRHLVADATGETIMSVARACLGQFCGIEPIEHVWSLVRTGGMMTKVLQGIEANPGPVLYTMVNHELRDQLITRCTALSLPCIPVLEPVIHALANYFGVEIREIGRAHV